MSNVRPIRPDPFERSASMGGPIRSGVVRVPWLPVSASPADEELGKRVQMLAEDLTARILDTFGWTEMPLVLTQPEVAKVFCVDVRKVRAAVRVGGLPSMRIGARDWIPTHALIEELSSVWVD